MNILNPIPAVDYKLAFSNGLILSGAEEGRPLWLGTNQQMNNYWDDLERYNKI